MGGLSPLHWVIIIAVVLLVFGGRGKLSGLMGDAAKGVRAFRDGLKGEEAPTNVAESKPAAAPLPPTETRQHDEVKS